MRPLTLSGPLEVVPAGAVARLQVGPFDRSFDFVLSRYGQTRPIVRGGRIGGLLRVARAAPDAHRRLPRARPGGRPPGRLAAGGGGPAPDARVGRAATAAHGPPGAHLAGTEPGGQRPRRLRRHAAGGAEGAARARLRRRRAAAGLSLRDRAAAALPRRRRARLRPDHRPVAGAPRGSRARERSGCGVRRQRALDHARAGQAPALVRARRRPARLVRRGLVPAPGGARRGHAGPRRAAQARRRVRRADGPRAHRRGAARGVPGRPRAVRGAEPADRRVHAVRALGAAARRARSSSPRPGATWTSPRSSPTGWRTASVLRSGTPQWARELDESRLSVEVPRVTGRIWALLSGRG